MSQYVLDVLIFKTILLKKKKKQLACKKNSIMIEMNN